MFLRAAVTSKVEANKADILKHWTANHADDKAIKEITDSKPKKATEDEVGDNWKSMKTFFGGIK